MSTASPLTWIELSRSALKKNITTLTRLAGGRLLAVSVKANAYGHGLEQIVPALQSMSEVDYVTVHAVEEAIRCRRVGWDRKIMVLGPLPIGHVEAVIEYDLEPVVCTMQVLRAIGKLAAKQKRRVATHLKLETGTHRQGITLSELPGFARIYKGNQWLRRPFGAGMHFANIEDTTNHEYAREQLKRFGLMLRRMAALGIKPKVRHTASSAAMILYEKTRFDLVRPGIAAYGHWPSKETYLTYRLLGGSDKILEPVLSWKTTVTQIKKVPADSFVGYGCTYRTSGPTRLAVLPIGYADGYDRGLSNTAYVLINGKRAPVRGRVCMNLTMVDVSDIKGVGVGQDVSLVGRDGRQVLAVEQLADWAGTINYEVLARLSADMPRILVR